MIRYPFQPASLTTTLSLCVCVLLGGNQLQAEDATSDIVADYAAQLAAIDAEQQATIAAAVVEAAETADAERAEAFSRLRRSLSRLERRVARDPAQAAAVYRVLLEIDPEHQAAVTFFTSTGTLEAVRAGIAAEPLFQTDFLGSPTGLAADNASAGSVRDGNGEMVIEAEHLRPSPGRGAFAAFVWGSVDDAPAPWNQPGTAHGAAVIALSPADAGRRSRTVADAIVDANHADLPPGLSASIPFDAAGTWVVWVRASAPNDNHNSVRFLLNGEPVGPNLVTNRKRMQWNRFVWCDPFEIEIPSRGTHTLTMLMRESGTAVDQVVVRRLDRFGLELPTR